MIIININKIKLNRNYTKKIKKLKLNLYLKNKKIKKFKLLINKKYSLLMKDNNLRIKRIQV